MSFGDHLEGLRLHLWRAIVGLVFCMVIGFVLDSIVEATGFNAIGIGRPLMGIIEAPVKHALEDFYDKRREKFEQTAKQPDTPEAKPSELKPFHIRRTPEQVANFLGIEPGDVRPEQLDDEVMLDPKEMHGAVQGVERLVYPPGLSPRSEEDTS